MEGYDNFGIFSHIFPHRHVFNGKRSTDNTIYLSSGGFILVSHSITLACAGILHFFFNSVTRQLVVTHWLWPKSTGLVAWCKFKFLVNYFSFILLLLIRMKTKEAISAAQMYILMIITGLSSLWIFFNRLFIPLHNLSTLFTNIRVSSFWLNFDQISKISLVGKITKLIQTLWFKSHNPCKSWLWSHATGSLFLM